VWYQWDLLDPLMSRLLAGLLYFAMVLSCSMGGGWAAPAPAPAVSSLQMPRYFEPNWGVAEPGVKYLSRGGR